MNKIMQYKNGIPIKSYKSVMEIQKKTGYSRSHISECLNGKRKTAYGYEWEYQPRIKGKWKYWFKSKNEMIKDVTFLCDENDRKDKQLEAYENMRKELLELILFYFPALDQRESNFKDELLNILNKVGEDNANDS
jgi:hypothetical protein